MTAEDKLEEKVSELLKEAANLIDQKGRTIKLYWDKSKKFGYLYFSKGIQKYWREIQPNGDPITNWDDISETEFLEWVGEQDKAVRQQVHDNLVKYIDTETPKERGEVEFPESDHLFGY